MRPGEPLDVLGRRASHLAAALRLIPKVPQSLGQYLRVACGHEHAVDAVADDVPVAGDVRGDDRRSGRERLGQNHPEALAADRWCAQDVRLLEHPAFLFVVDLAEHPHATGVEHQRTELLGGGADHGQLRRNVIAQRLEGAQQQRQALALDGLADEHDPQPVADRSCGGECGAGRVDVDAVGDDPVVAAEPATAGPGCSLGDCDPHVQPVEHPPRAHRVGEHVRKVFVRVRVERADEWQTSPVGTDPAQQRRDRLVDVDHVVAAGTQLAVHRGDTVGCDRQVRDGAVGLEADRPSERDEVVGRLDRLWPGATMQTRRKAARRIERGEDADVVALFEEPLGQRLDVPRDAPGYVQEYGETSAMRII